MKVLVIYDLIPDETKKAIVNMTENEYEFFKQANNKIANVDNITDDESDAINVIDAALGNYGPEDYEESKEKKYAKAWLKFKLDKVENIYHVDKFIYTGFYI